MSRPRKSHPEYRLHKASGQGVVTLTDGLGGRQDVLLGTYNTKASKDEYDRVINEWVAAGRRLLTKSRSTGAGAPGKHEITVNELLVLFMRHAATHYRRADGTETGEVRDYTYSLRPLKHLYGDRRASEVGPLAMKAVRQLMLDGYQHPKYGEQASLARKVVNQRIARIVRVYQWGVSEELVEGKVWQELKSVKGLQKGRTDARETAPVRPVAHALVIDTLPYLTPPVRDMVNLQLNSGMRPGELVIMRTCDLDTSGSVWLYYPSHHKTAHRDQTRCVPLGPKCQEIVRRYLKTDLQAYLFSPRETMLALWEERRKERKSPMTPSQSKRKRKRKPGRGAGERYSVASYGRAVAKACERLNQSAIEKARENGEQIADDAILVPSWHPHQLRHSAATLIRKEAGLDAARAILGHTTPVVTELYAEMDRETAVAVMGKLG